MVDWWTGEEPPAYDSGGPDDERGNSDLGSQSLNRCTSPAAASAYPAAASSPAGAST
ncbi:hypothetical protein BH18ACT7_BH18ACT7_17970 [soil metagenome]